MTRSELLSRVRHICSHPMVDESAPPTKEEEVALSGWEEFVVWHVAHRIMNERWRRLKVIGQSRATDKPDVSPSSAAAHGDQGDAK